MYNSITLDAEWMRANKILCMKKSLRSRLPQKFRAPRSPLSAIITFICSPETALLVRWMKSSIQQFNSSQQMKLPGVH